MISTSYQAVYTIVFADDANVFLSGKDPDVLSEMMNK